MARELGSTVLLGTPKCVNYLFSMIFSAVVDVIFTKGFDSIHLVNVSMATMKNLNPPGAVGNGPRRSIPQVTNAHDKGLGAETRRGEEVEEGGNGRHFCGFWLFGGGHNCGLGHGGGGWIHLSRGSSVAWWSSSSKRRT
jgi:hypothetical protein